MPRNEEAFQQIRDERREQILQKADRLFLERGVASLRIGDLAKEVGMSQGLMYRYFANKEEIMANLVERAKGKAISAAVAKAMEDLSPSFRAAWGTVDDLSRPEFSDIFGFACPSWASTGSYLPSIVPISLPPVPDGSLRTPR